MSIEGITLDQVRERKEQLKHVVNIVDAFERLCSNNDFKLVFLDNYVEKEPTRLVQLLGDPAYTYGDNREAKLKDLHERMLGIAYFTAYMRGLHIQKEMALKDLDNLSEAENEYYRELEDNGV